MSAPDFPQQDQGAERALLGSFLTEMPTTKAALERHATLSPDVFYSDRHKLIYGVAVSLNRESREVTLLSVLDRLRTDGTLDAAGGEVYVAGLVEEAATPLAVDEPARIVLEQAERRRLARLGYSLQDAARKAPDLEDLRARFAAELGKGATGSKRGKFNPRPLGEVLAMGATEMVWTLPGFLAPSRLTIMAGPPRVGKSTLASGIMLAVARGGQVLGVQARQGRVLWISTEETPEDIGRRLCLAGVTDADPIAVHADAMRTDDLPAVKEYVIREGVALVVIDSLSRTWRIKDENDSRAVEQGMAPILALARDTKAAVLVLHHTNKTGGDTENAYRGSSDLLASTDIGLLLHRDGKGTRRVLTSHSRFAATPGQLVVELDPETGGYTALGAPSELKAMDLEGRVLEALEGIPEPGETLDGLQGRLHVNRAACSAVLSKLAAFGRVRRIGSGRRGDASRYLPADSVPVPPLGLGDGNGIEAAS